MSRQRYSRLHNTQEQSQIIIAPPDKTLFVIVIFLVVIGVMAIFSAGAPKCIAAGENPAGFAIKQLMAIVVGFFGLRFFMSFDYKKLSRYALHLAIAVIVSLLLVKFTPLGIMANGAKRWMMLGPIQFQPSELAKIAVILLLSNAFCRDAKFFVMEKFIKYYIPVGIIAVLVFMQPNLSMVLLLMIISAVIFFSAGGSLWFLTVMGVPAVYGLSKMLKGYQMTRLKIWLNPEIDAFGAGYNIIQSLIAFAGGGFWGEGYGNSKQKLAWLPEGHTDFIFAVIAEEMGFVGCVFLICIFAAFIHRGLIISSRCGTMFGKLLAVGITLSIGIQAFINMAVSSAMVPATGVPMPFISYGGTSIVVSLCMVGILLNISRKRIKKIKSYDGRRISSQY